MNLDLNNESGWCHYANLYISVFHLPLISNIRHLSLIKLGIQQVE